ncbi:MAG: PIN domain-containing protein [Bryobacterales bacterium]|nr:PIN domain-containing protein [Bryobacterales bacterium]
MGLTSLRAFLRHHRRIALDTNVFIYQLEANPRYVSLTDQVFDWLEQGNHAAVTSTITLTELLVPAYRSHEEAQVNEFYALLTKYPNLDWIAPELEIADLAANIRSKRRLASCRRDISRHGGAVLPEIPKDKPE